MHPWNVLMPPRQPSGKAVDHEYLAVWLFTLLSLQAQECRHRLDSWCRHLPHHGKYIHFMLSQSLLNHLNKGVTKHLQLHFTASDVYHLEGKVAYLF